MSVQKYVSQVKDINWSKEMVYSKLSDLNTLGKLYNPENIERAKEQLGDKADKFNLEDFSADSDSCSFTVSPIGRISLRIIDREENKTIKIQSEEGIPGSFTLWIQLLPVNENSCKSRLTLHADMNMMMKMMLGKKLSKGIDQFADGLTRIPFGNL